MAAAESSSSQELQSKPGNGTPAPELLFLLCGNGGIVVSLHRELKVLCAADQSTHL